MRILKVNRSYSNGSVDLKVRAGELEFRHLLGNTDSICMIATRTINVPFKTTKKGARHNYSRWLLLPVKLSAKFSRVEFDYENAKAGFVKYKNSVLIVYQIKEKKIPVINEKSRIKNIFSGQIIKYFILKIFLTLLILISIIV